MTAVFLREFKSYFTSVTGYAFAAFLLCFTGIYTLVVCLAQSYTNYEYVLGSVSFIYLLIIPILTMRVFAEEKKQRTDQLLYSLPLSMTKIVLGKYFALLGVLFVPMIFIGVYPLILSAYGTMNFKIIYATWFCFFLIGAALISVGMFISSLTESQALAAGITCLVILVNYFSTSLVAVVKLPDLLNNFIEKISVFARLDNFIYGMFDLRAIVFLLTVIALFVFLTVQSLEKRRWS